MINLKARLQQPEILLAPGVYDALSALMAEQAGFEAVYVSGASVAYTTLGRSDVGLTTFTEVNEKIAQMRDRIQLPIIVDADTGFGNALNTERTVRGFERNGANVIQLEDQSFPKRCGHLDGKTVVSTAEMVGKIKAAVNSRHRADTLIMARTDAVAVEGFEQALERAEQYLIAGADILFIEAVRSDEQMRIVNERFKGRAPLLANMVEGGKTPDDRLAWGFRLVTARDPNASEVTLLKSLLTDELARYRKDPEAAKKAIANGQSKPNPALDSAELAAYTLVGNLLLNLDETVMKN